MYATNSPQSLGNARGITHQNIHECGITLWGFICLLTRLQSTPLRCMKLRSDQRPHMYMHKHVHNVHTYKHTNIHTNPQCQWCSNYLMSYPNNKCVYFIVRFVYRMGLIVQNVFLSHLQLKALACILLHTIRNSMNMKRHPWQHKPWRYCTGVIAVLHLAIDLI